MIPQGSGASAVPVPRSTCNCRGCRMISPKPWWGRTGKKRDERDQLRLSWSLSCSRWRIHPGKSCIVQSVWTMAKERHVDLQLAGAHPYCTWLTTGPCIPLCGCEGGWKKVGKRSAAARAAFGVPSTPTNLWKLSQGWTPLWAGLGWRKVIGLRGCCFTLFSDSNLLRAPDVTREIKRKAQRGKARKIEEKQIQRNSPECHL